MKIEFSRHHDSYRGKEPLELSDFTVLTGLNGAGKTRLLHYLNDKSSFFEINGIPNAELIIKYYSYDSFTFLPSETRIGTSIHDDSYLNKLWIQYKRKLQDKDFDPLELPQQIKDIYIYNNKQTNDILTIEDFKRIPINRENENLELFRYNFFKDAATYLTQIERNRFQNFKNKEYGEENIHLNEDEFVNRFGEPPWIIINEILDAFDFKYVFRQHELSKRINQIEFSFFDKDVEKEVAISSLSPGERTLLSIASSIYDLRIINKVPDVLLFDEVDALLHPSFSVKLVSFIQNYLVDNKGKKVILTTHSPSTVAVTQEGSVFLAERRGYQIKKINKDFAISILTEGINYLSIAFENRKQVFVEDESDSKIYEHIYLYLKQELYKDISLNFIPVTKSGVGGCSKVIEIVKSLTKSGNNQILGLIDFDLVNDKYKPPIFSLGNRYSIENYILDPIFIISLLVREKILDRKKLGIPSGINYFELERLSEDRLQAVIENFFTIIDFNYKEEDLVWVYFVNGKKCMMPQGYLNIKGHNLNDLIMAKFPQLIGVKTKRYSLSLYICKHIVDVLKGFISIDFLEKFRKMQIYK